MTTPEPTFAVPPSALADIDSSGDGTWRWDCRICERGAYFISSESEAESAAIAHLADVHGITPLVEETGEADVRRIGEALLDVLPEVYGYRVGDEPANLDGALGRDAEKIAARLRSAGDGTADVERRAWSAKPGEPICNRMYSGEYWVAKTCIKVLGHDGGHADWYGRTWNQDERDGARLRSAGDGAADVLGKSAEWGLVNDRGDLTLVPAPDRVTLRHLADSYVVRSVTRGEWVVPLDSRSPKPDPWSPEPEVRARPNRCYHGVAIGNSCPLCRFESRAQAPTGDEGAADE